MDFPRHPLYFRLAHGLLIMHVTLKFRVLQLQYMLGRRPLNNVVNEI